VIFFEIEKITEELKKYHSNTFRQIILGSPVEFGTTILIRHMQAFMENHPNFHLDFFFSHHLRESLLCDEVDFIIDCNDHPLTGIEKIFLFQEHYITIASPEFIEKHDIRQVQDLRRIKILSLDKEAVWWSNFIAALPEKRRVVFGHVQQINHVRGLINGAVASLGIGFVPSYTVTRELQEKRLVDPFPEIKPTADQFNIFIKKKKMKLKKNQILIDYLKQVKPVEFLD
jgi:DNA-binding transcriptional LysR family regulator